MRAVASTRSTGAGSGPTIGTPSTDVLCARQEVAVSLERISNSSFCKAFLLFHTQPRHSSRARMESSVGKALPILKLMGGAEDSPRALRASAFQGVPCRFSRSTAAVEKQWPGSGGQKGCCVVNSCSGTHPPSPLKQLEVVSGTWSTAVVMLPRCPLS